jgi:hypothetical protein
MRVMYAMCDDPLDWSAFESQRTARHEKVFDEFRHLITTMREQPVPAHADAKTARHPVEDDGGNECGPAPEKESYNRSNMQRNQKNAAAPICSSSFWKCGLRLVSRCH